MKNRGFTLVEILAVITLIGVLALITIPTIDVVIKSTREKGYENQKEVILSAAKDYGASNMMELPTVDGDYVYITLGDLKLSGFIEVDVINPINELCISNDTVIVITRKNNNYTYKFQDENNIRFTESCEVDEIE
jgi:prepilin-type N-terminal cleavage/methylation domain-containing protein